MIICISLTQEQFNKKDNMKGSPLINETLLQMKYARIVSLLAKQIGITRERALGLFYTSDTYTYLSERKYHLHNMGDAYLVDEIIMELQRKQ